MYVHIDAEATILIDVENSFCCLVCVYKANSDTLPFKNLGKNVSHKKKKKNEMNTFIQQQRNL